MTLHPTPFTCHQDPMRQEGSVGSRTGGQAGEPQRASSRPPPQASRGPSAPNGHTVYDLSATNSVQAIG